MERHSELEVVPDHHVYGRAYVFPEIVRNNAEDDPHGAVPIEYKVYSTEASSRARIESTTAGSAADRSRRKCGLPIRIFYVVLMVVILLVVIGAVVGGVLGSLKARQREQDSPMPTQMPGNETNGNGTAEDGMARDGTVANGTVANQNILVESRLSATNWTDTDGVTHRFVFFQDTHSAIIARIWDGENKIWATTNLTDILKSTRTPLSTIGPYTPLTSVAISYKNKANEIHLYWIAPDNTIASVASNDLLHSPDDWKFDDLDGAELVTSRGSQLAAVWTRCWFDCKGWPTLAYQREGDYGINVANTSDFLHAMPAVDPRGVAQNTSLAMVAEYQTGRLTRLTLMSESLGSVDSGSAQKTTYENEWGDDGNLLHESVLPPPGPSVQFAISQLDNFASPVFLSLLPNGTVIGEYYEGYSFINLGAIEFSGGPSGVNFSAIAASEEAMFYGVSDDQILQYSIDAKDPSKFEFVGTVYP